MPRPIVPPRHQAASRLDPPRSKNSEIACSTSIPTATQGRAHFGNLHAYCRGGIDRHRKRSTGRGCDPDARSDRVEIERRRPTRDQRQVSHRRSRAGDAVRLGRRVYQHEISAAGSACASSPARREACAGTTAGKASASLHHQGFTSRIAEDRAVGCHLNNANSELLVSKQRGSARIPNAYRLQLRLEARP